VLEQLLLLHALLAQLIEILVGPVVKPVKLIPPHTIGVRAS
jgi:hypothetical protein